MFSPVVHLVGQRVSFYLFSTLSLSCYLVRKSFVHLSGLRKQPKT